MEKKPLSMYIIAVASSKLHHNASSRDKGGRFHTPRDTGNQSLVLDLEGSMAALISHLSEAEGSRKEQKAE